MLKFKRCESVDLNRFLVKDIDDVIKYLSEVKEAATAKGEVAQLDMDYDCLQFMIFYDYKQ